MANALIIIGVMLAAGFFALCFVITSVSNTVTSLGIAIFIILPMIAAGLITTGLLARARK